MKRVILFLAILFLTFPAFSKTIPTVEVYYANSENFRITVTDQDYDATSLTGYTIRFRLFAEEADYVTKTYQKDNNGAGSDLNLAYTNATQSGTTLGQATISLTITNLTIPVGTYYLYNDLTNAGGTVVRTLSEYKFIVLPQP